MASARPTLPNLTPHPFAKGATAVWRRGPDRKAKKKVASRSALAAHDAPRNTYPIPAHVPAPFRKS